MPESAVRVLLVEDDEDDYLLTRDWLSEVRGTRYVLDRVSRYDEALALLLRCEHDVYLLDYRLGGRNGLELLREALASGCSAPIIVLTGQGDRGIDLEAMEAGASDYLVKGEINSAVLERSIRYAIERKRTEETLRRARLDLERIVQERTADLALANDQLRLRVEELDHARERAEMASRAKDQFLAMLSHELRTPLNPVLLATSAYLSNPDAPPEIREILELVRRNIELEATMIDDLLDVMRIIRGKLDYRTEVADLHDLLTQSIEICRGEIEASPVSLIVDLGATKHHARVDSARIKQVFWNLIKNAVKFSPGGGTLTISTWNEGDGFAASVSDTGMGIDPRVLPIIFNAFEQGESHFARSRGGLGLGLAICRAVAEAHGGRLDAASAGLNQGATFTVRLATVPVEARPLDAPAEPSVTSAIPEGLRVLLVEDDPMTLRIMAKLLRESGLTVRAAEGFRSALSAADEDFDLLISDIGLSDGTGLDLIRQLSARRSFKGIALTGYGMEDDVARCREAGFQHHLTKPINFPRLLETIHALYRSSEPAPSSPR